MRPPGMGCRRLDEHRLASFDGRFVLVLTLALTGGVDRFVTERCRDFPRQGLFPLVLRPTPGAKPGRFELWTDALKVPDLRYDVSADLAPIRQLLPALPIRGEPHGPELAAEAPRPAPAADGIVRVALIGALGEHKGYRVLLECARDAKKRRLPLQFVVIGYTENDRPLLETGKVFVTGRYTEGEAVHLIGRERPQLAFMPSVWPETWCFALDHVVRAGLPVVAFELGAIAERLRAAGLGILLPLDCKPREINDRLLEIAALEANSRTTTRRSQTMINGSRGMLVVPARGPEIAVPAIRREVYDVTGAGDTVIAVLALSLAAQSPLLQAVQVANAAAGVSVGQVGAVAVDAAGIRNALAARPDGKIVSRHDLGARAASWRMAGKRIVLTNGCFDLLHAGHLSLLSHAAQLGDILVLAINSDA